jgi:hypothetical protein
MNEPDPLDAVLREWKSAEPDAGLDQRVMAAYRSASSSERDPPGPWRRFWTMQVSVPAPALVAAALAIFVIFLWLRPSPVPEPPVQTPGAVTRLNVSGFQPLPNGEARVVPAREVQK